MTGLCGAEGGGAYSAGPETTKGPVSRKGGMAVGCSAWCCLYIDEGRLKSCKSYQASHINIRLRIRLR